MKRIALVFALFATLISCKSDMSISLSTDEMKFDAAGGTIELYLECNTDWEIETEADWITLSKTSGDGDETIKVTTTENTSSARESSIKVVCSKKKFGASQTSTSYITVNQEGAEK